MNRTRLKSVGPAPRRKQKNIRHPPSPCLADGTNGDAIVLGPPFVTTDEELIAIADRLTAAIESATAAVSATT